MMICIGTVQLVMRSRGSQIHPPYLPLRRSHDRWQPSALPRVHQQEHGIVFINKLLQLRHVNFGLFDALRWYRMPRHRYHQLMTRSVLQSIRTSQSTASKRMLASECLTIPGKIFLRRAAAVAALGFPPSRQSSNSKRGCRTGLEKDTRAESTNVIFRTPHALSRKEIIRSAASLMMRRGNKYHERPRNVTSERARAEQ